MSEAEIAEAEAYTLELAEAATPGVTSDLGEAVGDTLETGGLGVVFGGGMAVAHRLAQAQGFATPAGTIWRKLSELLSILEKAGFRYYIGKIFAASKPFLNHRQSIDGFATSDSAIRL